MIRLKLEHASLMIKRGREGKHVSVRWPLNAKDDMLWLNTWKIWVSLMTQGPEDAL
jgi:hypothetical protein